MNPITRELIAICRLFGAFERGSCCGDVSTSQCVVLQELLEGDRDITALSAHAGGSRSAMTRLVDGLARRGYVARIRSSDDRRRVLVRLTPEGMEEARRLRDLTERVVSAMVDRIPRGKRRQVLESMRLIRESLYSCCPGSA